MIDLNNNKKLVFAVSTYCSLVLAVVLIGHHDKLSSIIASILSVLSPLIIGFTMAYLLNPILNFFEKTVFKFIKNKMFLRIIGVFFTYLALASFLLVIGLIVVPQVTKSIADLANKFDSYKLTAIDAVNSLLQKLKDMNILSDEINADTILNFVNDNFTSGSSILKNILSYLANNIDKFLIIPRNILIGLFISVYALFTKERLGAQSKKLAKAILSSKVYETLYNRIKFTHSTFGGYFTGVVIDAIFVGVVTFLGLVIFGVPYASLVAVLVAVTNVIPVFGPFLGSIPAALIIFISEPSKVIVFIIMILLIQQIDGNIIAPKILGNSTGMSSLAVITAITVMGSSFGFMGMLIGVPVFAVIIALIKELVEERLRIKELPVETANYYPRNSFAEAPRVRTTLFERLHKNTKKILIKLSKKEKEDNNK